MNKTMSNTDLTCGTWLNVKKTIMKLGLCFAMFMLCSGMLNDVALCVAMDDTIARNATCITACVGSGYCHSMDYKVNTVILIIYF